MDKEEYLQHYGVLGMKWGKRKQKNLAKSVKKGNYDKSIKTIKNEISNSEKYSELHKSRQSIKKKYGSRKTPSSSKEVKSYQEELTNVANKLVGKYGNVKLNKFNKTVLEKTEHYIDSSMSRLYNDVAVYGKYGK